MSVIILKFNGPDYFVLKFTKLIKNYWVGKAPYSDAILMM